MEVKFYNDSEQTKPREKSFGFLLTFFRMHRKIKHTRFVTLGISERGIHMRKYYKKHKLLTLGWGLFELVVALNSILLSAMMQFIVAIATGENGRTIEEGVFIVITLLMLSVAVVSFFLPKLFAKNLDKKNESWREAENCYCQGSFTGMQDYCHG